jgi:hypothetical protein
MINRPLVTKRIAYHESGHAVAAYLLHHSITEVKVFVNKYDYYGRITYDALTDGRPIGRRIEESALISCAGNAAECLLTGRKYWSRSTGDYIDAVNGLSWLYGCKDEIAAYIDFLWIHAKNLLAEPENWYAVKHLAEYIECEHQEPGYWAEGEYYINYDYEDTLQMDGFEVKRIISRELERYFPHEEGLSN